MWLPFWPWISGFPPPNGRGSPDPLIAYLPRDARPREDQMTPAKRSKAAPTSAPTFRELPRDECDALLARNHVGRVAFSFHDRVDLEPVHYVYAEGWIHGRTAPGAKVAVLRHHPWVAFEVDEVEGLFDWQSVVV